ncbi:hypothetical protein [Ottowia sp. VDI28]|uniref:hypothetical protein n=1 Tax=Ottowia sp. VDI28 TaxID=3133968 RepID=UPI003C2C553C
MIELSISVGDLASIARGMRQAPEYTNEVLQATMTEATLLTQREWQENLPRVTGLTANSITSDIASTPAGVLGIVSSSQPSAVFIELGTKPHMPPVAALVPWVKAVLGIRDPKEAESTAFLVARKIAREGTPARHPGAQALSAVTGQVVAMFERAAAQIAKHLVGGTK